MGRRLIHQRLREKLALRLRLEKRFRGREGGPFLVDTPPGERLLVLAPHPDDEVLGCGGTLAKLVRAGKLVEILFLTGGEKGKPGARPDGKLAEERRDEAHAAARVLGIERLHFWNLPDLALSAGEETSRRLIDFLEEERPDTVFCPSPFERHPDHRAAFDLLQRAPLIRRPDCWLYEVWNPLVTNYSVDISSTWELKLAALREYRSQLVRLDYAEKGLGLNAFRSLSYEGIRYVESFLWLTADELARWNGLVTP